MLHKPLGMLERQDLRTILGTSESKTLEFKRELPARDKEEITKFLAAVTSFANTTGGDLFIGITADKGIATNLTGVTCTNSDSEILRLHDLLKEHAEPRLPGIEIKAITIDTAQVVLIIRIPRSWHAPHRVKTDNKFYGRTSAGKYPLDVAELRSAFLRTDAAGARLRQFHYDRLLKLSANDTPVPLLAGPRAILHVMSLPMIGDGSSADVAELLTDGTTMPLPFGRQGSYNQSALNLDGCVTWINTTGPTSAYTQVFRTGALEGVLALADNNHPGYLHIEQFEHRLLAALQNYFDLLPELSMAFPVTIFVAFSGMTRCEFRYSAIDVGGSAYYQMPAAERDLFQLPDAVVQEPRELRAALTLPLSALWNAYGLRRPIGRTDLV